MSRITRAELSRLATRIDRDGINADPSGLEILAKTAQDSGLSPVTVGVMVDESEPESARIRAYVLVSAGVSAAIYEGV